jgi:hypothetical protein
MSAMDVTRIATVIVPVADQDRARQPPAGVERD